MPHSLIAVSISHQRAPVEVREQLELSEAERTAVLGELRELGAEALVLSTCNRTEIYAGLNESDSLESDRLVHAVLDRKRVSRETFAPYFEHYTASSAIRQLFRVTAGIDSQILGDQQIFAQVKEAFRKSQETEASGAFLGKLAQAAFRVGKRVISETSLFEGAATVSYAAVEFARKIYDDLRFRHVLVIGAGETGELTAKHFAERHAGRITVANRSPERARELADRVRLQAPEIPIETISLAALDDVLPLADIIVSATSAPDYVLTEPALKAAMAKRTSSSPLVMIDIAVPRDIDPAVGSLSNVFLKDIDDLRTIVDRNTERRRLEVPKAEAIIEEEIERFLSGIARLEAGPTIKELRDRFEAVRKEELDRNRHKLDERSFALVEEMSRRMMNRLLHQPTVSLKEVNGADRDPDALSRIALARELFGLDKDEH